MLTVAPRALGPPNSSRKPVPGIEGPAVLVEGDAEGVRIVPVDVLCAVAVMAVRIHNGDPFGAVVFADVLDHDRFDVDIAEAAGAVDDEHRMVTRRPDQREGVVHLSGEDLLRRGDGAARRDEMRFRDDAEGIGDADMRPVDVLGGCQSRFVLADVLKIEESLLEDLILGIEKTFLPFRVVRRDGPVEGREKDQTGAFLRFQASGIPTLNPAMAPGLIWTLTRIFFPVV